MARYLIRQDLLPLLVKSIAPIARKAVKNGISFTFNVFNDSENIIYKESDRSYAELIPYIPVELDMKVIYNDWNVIMSIEESDSGVNKVVGLYESVTKSCYEKYLSEKIHCEHCNCNRRRKYAFLLKNINNGELKLVGSSCLAEFTNGLDAGITAKCFEAKCFIMEMEKRSSHCSDVDKTIVTFDKLYVLGLGVYFTKQYGYKKRTEGELSTSDRVKIEINARLNSENGEFVEDKITAEITEEANVCFSETKRVLENKENKSMYEINLLQMLKSESVAISDVGLLVSAISYYLNNVKPEDESNDEYFGNIGDKIDIDIDVNSVKSVYINTMFGAMYINTFKDLRGHCFVWKTGKCLTRFVHVDLFDGTNFMEAKVVCCRIRGTISEHSEYNGKKQTELKRCKILSDVFIKGDGNILLSSDVRECYY